MTRFLLFALMLLLSLAEPSAAFSSSSKHVGGLTGVAHELQKHQSLASESSSTTLFALTKKRRQQLGVDDTEDEYDLDVALENNTDPLISKIVAGSLILTMIALLVIGLVIPLTTDYGEGVCNALLTGGRC